MTDLLLTLRTGVRSLRREPPLAAVAVITLGLGIGLTAAMFSIVHGALAGLPFEEPDRLVHLERNKPAEDLASLEVSIHDFEDWRARQTRFEDLAAFYMGSVAVVDDTGHPERYDAAYMSAGAFDILRARPALGRTLRPEDDRPGAPAVVVLGHHVWRSHFGGSPEVLGQVIRIDGEPMTVVGVMPEGFRFPFRQDLWLPLGIDARGLQRGEGRTLEVFGRLAPGSSLANARIEMAGIARELAAAYPETNEGIGVVVKPYTEEFIGKDSVTLLYTMLLAVFGLLLVACSNVANLLLARSVLRTRDVAVRAALGAARSRVVLEILAESLLLAVAGAALGLVFAHFAVRAFERAIEVTDPPYWIHFGIDPAIAASVLAATVLSGLLSGLLPALRASRARPAAVLQDESRGTSSLRLGRLARVLVVLEIAVSCGLLVPTGLMIKSVEELRNIDYGFPIDGVFTARLSLPEADYPSPEARVRYLEALDRKLSSLPGVRSEGLATALPLLGARPTRFAISSETYGGAAHLPRARRASVTPNLFSVFRVRAEAGRLFDAHDRADTVPVAVVTRPFVDRFLPDRDPLGQRVRLGEPESGEPWRTIVGVVPDLYMGGPQGLGSEGVYVPLAQDDARVVSLAVATAGNPMALTQAVRGAVASLDPNLPIYFVSSMKESVAEQLWFVDVFGVVFVIFGVSGLFLALVGLYGVISFSVGRRGREMGIRMALGARRGEILRLVLRQAVWQVATGVVLGLGLAVGLAQGVRFVLFRVRPGDPAVYIAVVTVLAVAGLSAALIPALRATRADPAAALRHE